MRQARRATTSAMTLVTAALASSLLLMLPHLPGAESRPSTFDSTALLYSTSTTDCPTQRSLRVTIEEGGKAIATVTLHLMESSSDFLHSSERIGGRGSGGHAKIPPCFYQGSVEGDRGLVVAKLRNGLLSGNFHYGGRVYEMPEQPLQTAAATPLKARKLPPAQRGTCGVTGKTIDGPAMEPPAQGVHQHHEHRDGGSLDRRRRSLKLDINSNVSKASTKYITLLLAGDQYFYVNQSSSMTKAQDRLWDIGNYVNALYKQLGVNVITVYTEAWQTDPYTLYSAPNPGGANSSELLDLFMNHRMRSYSARSHTAAHLISGLKFSGTDVGLAHLGKLCTFSRGGGVNSDRDPSAYAVAVTVAHELGHNVGLNHDEEERGCRCPDSQGCIMAAVGGDVNPVQFSSCSIFRYMDFSVASGLGYCMSDPPPDAAIAGAKATCGNRIVEPGEDCDCGPARWCNNSCCNPDTCRFASGAMCASGECCNLSTCRLKSQGVTCRSQRDTCDLPEYCNGSSEWCPQFDDYKVDGTECLTGKAYCYKGRCMDRDSRCAAIFNGTNFRAADSSWSVGTTQGGQTGYCSYNENSLNPLSYTFTACSEANQRCGVLYCVGGKIASSDPSPRWKGMDPTDLMVMDTTVSGIAIVAAFVKFNLKYSGYRDPGMVPNGAECGTSKMCVDTQCVAATSSVTCPSCNGRGSCAQSGLCFCQSGYRPPDCVQSGYGGSTTNQPSADSSAAAPATTTATTTTITTTAATAPKAAGRVASIQPGMLLLTLLLLVSALWS